MSLAYLGTGGGVGGGVEGVVGVEAGVAGGRLTGYMHYPSNLCQ